MVENLKHVKLTLSLMIITVLMVSVCVPLTNPMINNELVHEPTQNSVLSYEAHDNIYIVNDTDFAAQAAIESWEGDGSPETPFLIQGYEIDPSREEISIQNTTLHFKILDCNITGAIHGVDLENVTNGVIQNCLFADNVFGIYMYNVTGIDVVGCSISAKPSGQSGVYMDDAIDCSISSCVIEGVAGSDSGIYGQYSEEITLFNNTVFEFDNHGISFSGCYDMDILNNTLYWNEGSGGGGPSCGIQIVESELADIIGNNITENMDNGITIDSTDNVTIRENHIVDNWYHGIYVESSDYTLIQDNWIEGHGDGIIEESARCGILTYFSDYTQIIGNEFWWNALNSITLGYSDFGYVFNNYINHSLIHGIWVYISHNATVEENEIYNSYGDEGSESTCGILVEWSNDTSLIHNTLGHNAENGITILNSHEGEVHGNTIFDSEMLGIYVPIGSSWEITHNVIYDNGAPGIFFESPAMNNLIYYNDIGWSGEFLVGDNGDNQWNYTGIGNWYSDFIGTGTYDISGSGGAIDFYPSVSLYCGVSTPSEYEAGTTGNTMTWNSSALNPGTYELLIDSEPQGPIVWDGGAIAADVDGLAVGVYNVTLIAYHVSGHWLANQSTLTVVDTLGPVWSATPVDQVLEYNEPLSYQLEATDPSGISSWAVNNTANFTISSAGLITNATTLAPGVYYLEITVTDEHSNSISVTIMITVNEPVPPTQPLDPALMLAIGGIGAGVVIIVIVIVLKKKGS